MTQDGRPMLRTLTGLTAVLASLPATADTPRLPDLPAPVSSFGAAVVGDHVYVYGGHSGGPTATRPRPLRGPSAGST